LHGSVGLNSVVLEDGTIGEATIGREPGAGQCRERGCPRARLPSTCRWRSSGDQPGARLAPRPGV